MDKDTWCSSCGSKVPAGADTCPECGMPVEDAYDDVAVAELLTMPTKPVSKDVRPPKRTLESAVPQEPKSGSPETSEETKAKRSRLVVVAAVAAFLLVGGVALYIAHPWDPNAYSIKATEEADTSMEGYPGAVTHLTGQDTSVAEKYQQQVEENQERLDQFEVELGQYSTETGELFDSLTDFLGYSAAIPVKDCYERAARLKLSYDAAVDEVRHLDLTEDDQIDQRKELMALIKYLDPALQTVCESWIAAGQKDNLNDAMEAARVQYKTVEDGRGIDEWYTLFTNAWASYCEKNDLALE